MKPEGEHLLAVEVGGEVAAAGSVCADWSKLDEVSPSLSARLGGGGACLRSLSIGGWVGLMDKWVESLDEWVESRDG